jgi:murein DD-endopeptidase MepM/ murein hydrolase activator NlpD
VANTQSLRHGSRGVRVALPLAGVAVAAFAYLLWSGLRQGAAPAVAIDLERAAIGRSAAVMARFSEPSGGLGSVRLELVQKGRTVLLAERSFARASAWTPLRGAITAESTLAAEVGAAAQPWLAEGEATLRATADRMAGFLRSNNPVVVERRVAVRLRPPALAVVSTQHYLRQGGSGVVVLRVGPTVARCGVRAGTVESRAFPLPGGGPDERFALFAVPPEVGDAAQINAFAEDDAGNRIEAPFVDALKKAAPRQAVMELSDAFLARVVPAIEASTPGLDPSGELVDRFVRINSALRVANLAAIAELARTSEERFLWSGAFLQMPNTQLRANFAERREYRYNGRAVDRQTHLGLDLASTARAPVPAANAGTVVFAGWLGIYGNAVAIDHGYGLMSLYGHLSAAAVAPGAHIEKGATIGSSGATGLAGGDHLHLEIFVQGHSVDPVEWLDEHWIRDNVAAKIPLPPQ